MSTVAADTPANDEADDVVGRPVPPADVPPRGPAGVGASDAWTPVSRVKTYELVLERIETQIVSGALRAGERLPPERDLATMLGVSRPAVREALRILESQGAVRSQVGKGPGSGTTIERLPSEALARLLRLHVALGSFALEDVVETRVALERASVVVACRRARPQDLARMRADLLAMDEPEIDRQAFNELDTGFHVALATAGGNRLMAEVTRAIRESMRLPIFASLSRIPENGGVDWPTVRDGLRADHHAVLAAVEAGQAAIAADRVEAHIRGFAAHMTAGD